MIASDDDVMMALSQELSAADKAGAGAGATGEGALDRRSRFMTGLPKKMSNAQCAVINIFFTVNQRHLSITQIRRPSRPPRKGVPL